MRATRIGVISDTHGLLRPEAVRALRGSNLILHAGDVGKPEVLESLRGIAPVVAIRGNNDKGHWADALPETEVVEVDAVRLYLIHDAAELDFDPAVAEFAAVISGHSHRPSGSIRKGVLYLNPGSAGPRRFTLPVSLARLTVSSHGLRHRLIELRI
ncbi:MAG TPA: metallophosphoesterase family protein [Myxococcota bacterium]|nr:metallophosphoesterase family protein [Myxococcota bacterium]